MKMTQQELKDLRTHLNENFWLLRKLLDTLGETRTRKIIREILPSASDSRIDRIVNKAKEIRAECLFFIDEYVPYTRTDGTTQEPTTIESALEMYLTQDLRNYRGRAIEVPQALQLELQVKEMELRNAEMKPKQVNQ